MYWETGVSFRFGEFRKMFSSSTDAIRDVNKYKTFSNIYHSIYGYEETEEKYDIITGKFKRIGPNYESAIINRIVLDLDSWNKDDGKEIYTEDGLESMRKMEDWGEKKNLLREYRFSGGGFYFIFGAVGHPLKLRDYEINLRNILRVTIDEATIGDTARMMRVTNSFNFKENRLCHCIPLTQDELCLSFNQIKELAEKTRFHKRFVYGENIENFNNCKMDKSKIKLKSFKINLKQNIDVDNLLSNYGWEVNDFCDTFKGILSKKHIGNYLRYEFIKYLGRAWIND